MPRPQNTDKTGPEFGYGKGRRPLWNARDRDAEEIRRLLRKAGCKEFGQGHRDGSRGGFAVEGGNGSAPFLVACAMYTRDPDKTPREMIRYQQALTAAGYRVEPDPGGDYAVWAVWRPSAPALRVRAGLFQRLLGRR